ncbi:MAG: DUF3433 domain-containing protein, partial [Acidobacteria bacterium]|nr:DUF3433 domain-containing protein [Acidobacteriota bacterium]
VRNDDNSIFWTTAAPATLLGLLACYYSSADNMIRTLSPFVKLKRGKSFRETVGLDLLDKSRLRIVWTAAMASDFAALSSTMAVLVGATLTIFASALFRPVNVPINADASIPTADYFASSDSMPAVSGDTCTFCHPETASASLILAANLTYPPFTFEDLAFQTLDTNATDRIFPAKEKVGTDLREMVISVTLPAFRSSLSCRVYSRDDLKVNLTLGGYEIGGEVNPLRIDTPDESCGVDALSEESNAIIPTAAGMDSSNDIVRTGFSGDMIFGKGGSDRRTYHCSDWFYAWGSIADANSDDTTVTNVGAMGCNETMEVVDTRLSFYGSYLWIDPDHPPEVDEGSARAATAEELEFDIYPYLANATSPHLVDQFFSLLVTSRYAVPPWAFSDPSAADDVVAAIRRQHGIIRAQDMNFNRRVSLVDGAFPLFDYNDQIEAVTPAFGTKLSPEEAVPSIQGKAESPNVLSHRRRLVQDELTTRVLQALLCAILFFAIISWVFTRDNRVPRSDALLSIASMASLLADGDVLAHMPREAEWMRPSKVKRVFKEGGVPMRFSMGWRANKGSVRNTGTEETVGGKQGPEVGVGEVEEYSNTYGSHTDEAYGIRVLGDGSGEGARSGSGPWGWLGGRRGYAPGRSSEP